MFNWEQIHDFHVTRKFRTILSRWWGVDIFFSDERGHLKLPKGRKPQDFENPLSRLFFQKELSQEKFQDYLYEINDYFKSNPHEPTCREILPGCYCMATPIKVSDEFMGTVTASFFWRENSPSPEKMLRQFFNLGFEEASLQQALNQVKQVDQLSITRLQDLTLILVEEIASFYQEITQRDEKITELSSQLTVRYGYDKMIGKSKPMQEIYSLLDKISRSESTCLIMGESGTGKELIAKAIHYHSPRNDKVFVVQNCGALNDNLLESELFGHVKGSFTGAIRDKKGLFEIANGGTLFLDEIGDTSLTMQVKLLRVLQEGTFLPVGGTDLRHVNVRVIGATNKNLLRLVEQNLFREDLFYRINVININLPPLRDRKEDIGLLAEYFLEKLGKEKKNNKKTYTKKALELLLDFNWPGNIRQLENEIERAYVLAGEDPYIGPDLLSKQIREIGKSSEGSAKSSSDAASDNRLAGKLKDAMEDLERDMILEGLKKHNWNKSKLAKELGISRAGLIMKVEKYGLDRRKIARI